MPTFMRRHFAMSKTAEFITKAMSVHGERYGYGKSNYTKAITKLIITCPEHGDFEQLAYDHKNGRGCNECANKVRQKEKKAKAARKYTAESLSIVHGGKYGYDKYVYHGPEIKSIFTCPKHGDFEQIPYTHAKGFGCSKCAAEKQSCYRRADVSLFLEECSKVHNSKYDYSLVAYTNAVAKITIVCPEHGEFSQQAHVHKKGQGCPECAKKVRGDKRRKTTEEFIKKAQKVFPNTPFDYSFVKYTGSSDKIKIICPEGHEFEQQPGNHLQGYGCSVCQISPLHRFLHEELGGEMNNRKVLGGLEVDLFFPAEKIAFEVNGIYYHSSLHKPKNYHQNKTELAHAVGIKLYHIWYDKNTDFELVLSWAKNKLGRTNTRIASRKCTIRKVPAKDFMLFLDRNHLQGGVGATSRLGLYHEEVLVSVMGFTKRPDGWHLSRFASERNTIIQGGFSRLLKNFIREHCPEKIISFSDMSYSDGSVYDKNGFTLVNASSFPKLYYTDGNVLHDRVRFQRKHIQKRRPDIPWSSEKEMAAAEGFYQLFGCKTVRWELDCQNMLL